MTLELAFLAETPEEAQQKAEAWIAAEPNVESGAVLRVVGLAGRWTVTVRLVMLDQYEQQSLALA